MPVVAGEGAVKGLNARMQAHTDVWQCAVLASQRGFAPLCPLPPPPPGVRLTHLLFDPTTRIWPDRPAYKAFARRFGRSQGG